MKSIAHPSWAVKGGDFYSTILADDRLLFEPEEKFLELKESGGRETTRGYEKHTSQTKTSERRKFWGKHDTRFQRAEWEVIHPVGTSTRIARIARIASRRLISTDSKMAMSTPRWCSGGAAAAHIAHGKGTVLTVQSSALFHLPCFHSSGLAWILVQVMESSPCELICFGVLMWRFAPRVGFESVI